MIQNSNQYVFNRKQKAKEDAYKKLSLNPPFPKNIMIETTNACNQSCVFCSNKKMTRKRKLIDKRLCINIIEQAKQAGADEIGFYTTGEPLLHKDLELFISKSKSLGFSYTYISTNGGSDNSERFKKLIDSGLDSIKFSINAGTKETYNIIHGKNDWDCVINNIFFVDNYRKQKKIQLKLSATYIVIPENKHECNQFRQKFESVVDDIYFNPGAGIQAAYMLENIDKGFHNSTDENMANPTLPCWQLFNRAHVTCEGFLNMCCIDFQNYLAVADLNKVKLIDAWTDPVFKDMRSQHINKNLSKTLCYNCINKEISSVEPLVLELSSPFLFKSSLQRS